MKNFLLTLTLLFSGLLAISQTMTVKKAAFYDKTPALIDMEKVVPGVRDRSWKDDVIRNEVDPRREHIDRSKETLPVGPDPSWQKSMDKCVPTSRYKILKAPPTSTAFIRRIPMATWALTIITR
ncbi:MAG: hypothetical protein U5L09_08605 [Bacteroidales bacterium]|nr:hypothetical protein [Bacteroidales bacterium]